MITFNIDSADSRSGKVSINEFRQYSVFKSLAQLFPFCNQPLSESVLVQRLQSKKDKEDTSEYQIDIDTVVYYDLFGRKKVIRRQYLFVKNSGLYLKMQAANKFAYESSNQNNSNAQECIRYDIKATLEKYLSIPNKDCIKDTITELKQRNAETAALTQLQNTIGEISKEEDKKERRKARGFKVFFEAGSDICLRAGLALLAFFKAEGFFGNGGDSVIGGLVAGACIFGYSLLLISSIFFIIGSVIEYVRLITPQEKIATDARNIDLKTIASPLVKKLLAPILAASKYGEYSAIFLTARHGLQIFTLSITCVVAILAIAYFIVSLACGAGAPLTIGLFTAFQVAMFIANFIGFIRQFSLWIFGIGKAIEHAKINFERAKSLDGEKKAREIIKGIGKILEGIFWNQRIWKMGILIFLMWAGIDCKLLFTLLKGAEIGYHLSVAQIGWIDFASIFAFLGRGLYNWFKMAVWDDGSSHKRASLGLSLSRQKTSSADKMFEKGISETAKTELKGKIEKDFPLTSTEQICKRIDEKIEKNESVEPKWIKVKSSLEDAQQKDAGKLLEKSALITEFKDYAKRNMADLAQDLSVLEKAYELKTAGVTP